MQDRRHCDIDKKIVADILQLWGIPDVSVVGKRVWSGVRTIYACQLPIRRHHGAQRSAETFAEASRVCLLTNSSFRDECLFLGL